MKHPMLKYLKESGPAGPRLPHILCPGCGSGQVLNYTLRAVDRLIHEDGLPRDRFAFISGVGCHARITSHYLNFDSGWTLHGRTLAVATGAHLANPDLKLIVFTGDGDTGAIGGNHFIQACRRNLDVTIICMNNGFYGMTGGQVSPTTALGQKTSTTPYGNVEDSFDLCGLARTAGATCVARWTTAHPQKVIKAVMAGVRNQGTAFIEVLSQCPTHHKESALETLKGFKERAVQVNRVNDPGGPAEQGRNAPGGPGRIVVGEFLNEDRPDFMTRYQRVMDEAADFEA
jgi:2-oxoglutarate/2-oxoacid ferredoxin oxidoreductase subunit beta